MKSINRDKLHQLIDDLSDEILQKLVEVLPTENKEVTYLDENNYIPESAIALKESSTITYHVSKNTSSTFLLRSDLHQVLARQATEIKKSVGDLVNEIVEQYLQKRQQLPINKIPSQRLLPKQYQAGSPTIIRQAVHSPPHLKWEDVDKLEQVILDNQLPIVDENIFAEPELL